MTSKKAQGLPLSMIIIGILVATVLIVIIMAFTGYFGIWSRSTQDCISQGGVCIAGQYASDTPSCDKKIRINAQCDAVEVEKSSSDATLVLVNAICCTAQDVLNYD